MRNSTIGIIGLWTAVSSVFFGLDYFVAQVVSTVKIPAYPRDLFWVFLPSLFLAPVFLISMIYLHFAAPKNAQVWTGTGTAFKWLYHGFLRNGALMPVLVLAFFYPVLYCISAVWMIAYPLAMINTAEFFKKDTLKEFDPGEETCNLKLNIPYHERLG